MDDLPIGWTKETRYRKYAGGFVKDTFYTNPENEHVFRSKKDVLRYLITKDIRSCAIKPRNISVASHIPLPSVPKENIDESRAGGFVNDFNNGAGSDGPAANFVEGKLPEISCGLDSNNNLGSEKLDLAGVEPHNGMPSLAGLSEKRNEANPHSLLEIMSGPSYNLAIRTLKGEIPKEYPTPLEPLPKPRAAAPVPKTHAFTPYKVSPNIDHVPNTNSLDELSRESAMYRAYTQKRPLPYSVDQNMYRPRVKMPSPSVVVPNSQLANKSVNDLVGPPTVFQNQYSGQLSSSAMPLYECDGINVGNMAQFMMMSSSSSESSSCFSTVVAAVNGYGPGGGRNDPDDSQHPSSSGSTPTESKKPRGNN